MPKQLLGLTDFSGGLNSGGDPTDLQANEFAIATDVSFKTPGIIELAGGKVVSALTAGLANIGAPTAGTGLIAMSSDYQILASDNTLLDDITAEATYLNYGNLHFIFFLNDIGSVAYLGLIQWTGSDMASAYALTNTDREVGVDFTGVYVPVMYTADGGIRIGIGNYKSDTAALQGRKILTLVVRVMWGGAASSLEHIRGWIFDDATPLAPVLDTNIHWVAGDADKNQYGVDVSGFHDQEAESETRMTDMNANFVSAELIGQWIVNTTDGSSGVITANTAITIDVAELEEGIDNKWQLNDNYYVSTSGETPPGLNQGYNDAAIADVGTASGLTIRMKYYDVYDSVHTNPGTWGGQIKMVGIVCLR